LVNTKNGKEYLISVIDLSTSISIVHALSERSAEAIIELLEELIWTYGLPKYVLTDNGSEFRSNRFQAILARYGIQRKRISSDHPQTDGKVE
jgi:transposase InsO family protein